MPTLASMINSSLFVPLAARAGASVQLGRSAVHAGRDDQGFHRATTT